MLFRSKQDANFDRRNLRVHLTELQRFTGKKISSSQLALDITPVELPSYGFAKMSEKEMLSKELELTGIDSSKHLLQEYAEFLTAIGAVRSCDVIKQKSGSSVLVAGVKVALQTPPVKSGKRVMFLTIEDGFGCNDLTFFEDAQVESAYLIRTNSLILAKGVLRRTGERGVSLRAEKAWSLIDEFNKWRQQQAPLITSVKIGRAHV